MQSPRRVGQNAPVAATNLELTPADVGIGHLFWLINDAIVVGDATTGRIVLWNPGAERVFGYTKDEAVGMPLAALVPPRMRDQHDEGLNRFAETGTITLTEPGRRIEVQALTASGEERWIELSLAPVPADIDGRYVVACIRDITQRRTAQDALRSFVDIAAHDLRSPLTAVTGGLQLLRAVQPEFTPQAEEVLAIIERRTQAVSNLVTDLLDLAQIDAGQPVHTQSVRVADALETIAAVVPEGDFAVEIEPADLAVTVDPTHLQRILTNLATNAVQHGEPPLKIGAAEAAGGVVEIVVCDSGPGVPADLRPMMFERFARRNAGGTGLGLAIARGLTEANGGTLRYERVGDDSCFVLSLPADKSLVELG